MYKFKELQNILEKELNPKRYEHSLSVAYLAASLAMCYGEDTESAFLAGLLHDCARFLTDDKILIKCKEYNIDCSDFEKRNAFLLHGKLGSYFASRIYGVESKDILNAILYHTTGRPRMSYLEKSIYISDYLELDRKHLTEDEFKELRSLAFHDINYTVYKVADYTIRYLENKDGEIDYLTFETRNYYKA